MILSAEFLAQLQEKDRPIPHEGSAVALVAGTPSSLCAFGSRILNFRGFQRPKRKLHGSNVPIERGDKSESES